MFPSELVILDCDGVLVDSEPISARCTAEVLNEAGVRIDDVTVLRRFMGVSARSMRRSLEAELGRELPGDLLERIEARTLEAFATELRPIAGAAGMLRRLGRPACVASSSTPLRIRRSLELTGLLDTLSPHLFSATMVERGKPAPDLFLYAAAEMGVRPGRCLVLEDSDAGVRAGKAAGMAVYGFAGGSHVTFEPHARLLTAAGADLVIERLTNLPLLLATRPAPRAMARHL